MLSIRTQDRMALVPYDSNIELRPEPDPDKKWRIDLWKECDSRTLGAYATKERALKILDEIMLHVIGCKYVTKGNKSGTWEEKEELPNVYQMPSE